MAHPGGTPIAPPSSLSSLIRANAPSIIESWAAESARIPFTKAADFSVPLEARRDRMQAYLDALVERMEDPGSRKAHEILRSTMRTEQQRSLNISSVIRNQHILRDILFGVVERSLPEGERQGARTAIEAMIDRSVEEIVLLLEDFTDTQAVLMRCLSCSPDAEGRAGAHPGEVLQERDGLLRRRHSGHIQALRGHEGADSHRERREGGRVLPKDRKVMFDSFPVAAEAIALRKVRTCLESSAVGGARKMIMGQLTFEHCLAIPLETDGRIHGLLFVADSSRSIHYTPDEVSMAEELAGHVLRVLENADIFEVLSVRSRAQKALIDTAVNLQKEIESEEIYRIVGDRVVQMIPVQRARVLHVRLGEARRQPGLRLRPVRGRGHGGTRLPRGRRHLRPCRQDEEGGDHTRHRGRSEGRLHPGDPGDALQDARRPPGREEGLSWGSSSC